MININKKLKSNQLVKSRMKSLASFSDIKHRLEIVKTVNEITWINDSKSTDAGATAFSLENLEGPIIWLVGFSENKRNLDLVNQLAQEKVSEIICYGNFETELKYYFAAKIKYGYKKDLSAAIHLAVQNAKPGYTVLFSPACSSYLNYDNYKQRGNHFKELVNTII
jgi:UDP-N-acetylmuramoylalanine--D-glutamate ligase